MSASGITLQPVLLSQLVSPVTAKTVIGSRYVVPSMRKAEPVNLTPEDFPSFGVGVVVPRASPRGATVGMILTLIERDQMEETERARRSLPEHDPLKMSPTQLTNAGWATLRLGNLMKTARRFNESVATDVWVTPQQQVQQVQQVPPVAYLMPSEYESDSEESYDSESE